MSAFVCSPEHIALLAAWAAHPTVKGVSSGSCVIREWSYPDNMIDPARNCAEGLMTENIRSVSIRYPHDADGERPGPGLADQLLISHARDMAEYYVFNLPKISPIAIIKMADCLYYQSCESDDWRDTKAYRQLQWIIGTAYRMMPGYDAAPWEFTDATMYQKAAHLFAESERARQAGIV